MPTLAPQRSARRCLLTWPALLALALATPSPALASGERSGAQIYRQMCLSCHGASGEGTEEYPRALAGDKSVPQLARLIAKTMPEDEPGTCVGEDADKVAAYLHESFYSRAAQERNKPPRIELSRLTVRQYQNAVADLVSTSREMRKWGTTRGLRGEYFKSGSFRDKDRGIDRVDPMVQFDFGLTGPEPETFDDDAFSIRWQGAVRAPETGEYEFVIRTEHAARLWVNDSRTPLIDAWVKSGNDNEYRGSIRLLGGRAYPLRLEFSKAKQGVKDRKKRPPSKASIALLWKVPQQALEIIPTHELSPDNVPETFVVSAAFPPDDRSVGYERGTSVSKAWDQATTDAAIEVAGHIASRLHDDAGLKDGEDPAVRTQKLRAFCHAFTARAFRRPLTNDQKFMYVDRRFEAASDPETAVRRVVLLTLKSPRFLYREFDDHPDGYDVAARLSFGLWDSLPDQALLDAAASGTLMNRDEVVRQAERMVGDPRTRAKVRQFLFQWLRVEPVPDVSKNPEMFPGFNPELVSDLRTSLDLFLDDVVWGETSDFRQLLLSDSLYLNGRLATFYGADLPADAPFQKVALEPKERAGVLSHPYLLSAFAYTSTSSPIHRGVFLSRSVLGRTLKPPPEAVAPLAPDLHASLTTRERVTLQTSPAACTTCHALINPLGFGLEHFDAVGRFRAEEKGKPVDASGTYETRGGETLTFSGARSLATALAASDETHAAFVEQFFHHLVKQPARAYGPRTLSELRKSFVKNHFDLRKLMVEVVAVSALAARDTGKATVAQTDPSR